MHTKYSIIAIMVALAPMTSDGAIKRANRAGVYQDLNAQVMAANAPSVPQSVDAAVASLPVHVADEKLAQQIVAGTSTTVDIDTLNKCAMSYPGAEMAWAEPTIGTKIGTGAQCVAVVDMVGFQMGVNGTHATLARGYLAAGDYVPCNISAWPEYTYYDAAGMVTFPADAAPTEEDVIAIMDEEQKQNAGLKIAASMIIGGIGGNIAGKPQPGSDKMMGGGRDKLISTAIGAVGAGALATAGSFSGKIAGDTIMGAGVNAAAGAVAGNMAASGSSVLRIERCKLPGKNGIEESCLYAIYVQQDALDMTQKAVFFNTSDMKTTVVCDKGAGTGEYTNCAMQRLTSVLINADIDGEGQKKTDVSRISASYYATLPDSDFKYFHLEQQVVNSDQNDQGKYYPVESAGIPKTSIPIAIATVEDKPFGRKPEEWDKEIVGALGGKNGVCQKIYTRTGDKLYTFNVDCNGDEFKLEYVQPMNRDSDDGGVLDLSNKARLKGTGIGAAAGGALGGYAAYEGAQGEIQERYVTAVREYKDSLTRFNCQSGTKWMASYNDVAKLPMMME